MATNNQEHSQRLGVEYLNLAFKDYIAARMLLNNNMLLQGAGLASSAIEKYLKAYALFAGKPLRRHLDPEFIESLKNGPGIPPYLSENFLLNSTSLSPSLRVLSH
jgi:hypothetical protein